MRGGVSVRGGVGMSGVGVCVMCGQFEEGT